MRGDDRASNAELRTIVQAHDALLRRVEQLEHRLHAGMHGLGWDAVRWVTAKQAAAVWGVRPDTVRNWCKAGTIPWAKLNPSRVNPRAGRLRIPAFWLMALPDITRVNASNGPQRPPSNRPHPGILADQRIRAERDRVLALAGATKPLYGRNRKRAPSIGIGSGGG